MRPGHVLFPVALALMLPASAIAGAATPASLAEDPGQPDAQVSNDPSLRAKPSKVISDVERGERAVVASVVETSSGGLEIHEQAVKGKSAAKAAVAVAQNDAAVRAVEVAVPYQIAASNDALRAQQWPLQQFAVESTVWPRSTGAGIKVAVVDSGVATEHPDLAGQLTPGADFVVDGSGTTPNTSDPNGHGTHVSGIIAAVAGNSIGIAGLAPAARIIPVRVLDDDGAGYSSDVAKGIVFAVDQGAQVINLSFGGQSSAAVRTALDYAQSKGSTVIAAMGNEKQRGNPILYPAADAETIAVAATTGSQDVASFSNTGAHADIAAPGVSILSTVPDSGYATYSGTSMAAPHVAALAALLLARESNLTPEQIRARVRGTAVDIDAAGFDSASGAGVIDPASAIGESGFVAPAPPVRAQPPATGNAAAPAPAGPVTNTSPEVVSHPKNDKAKKGKKVRFTAGFTATGDLGAKWVFKIAGEKRKLPGRATTITKSERTKLKIVRVKKNWSGAEVRAVVRNDVGVDRSQWASIRVR